MKNDFSFLSSNLLVIVLSFGCEIHIWCDAGLSCEAS